MDCHLSVWPRYPISAPYKIPPDHRTEGNSVGLGEVDSSRPLAAFFNGLRALVGT